MGDIGPIAILFVKSGTVVGSISNVQNLEVIIRDYDFDEPMNLDPDTSFLDTPLKSEVYSEGVRIFGEEGEVGDTEPFDPSSIGF